MRKLKETLDSQLARIEEQANAQIENAEKTAAVAEQRCMRAADSAAELSEENRKLQLALTRASTDDDTRLKQAEALADQYHAELQQCKQDAVSAAVAAAESMHVLSARTDETALPPKSLPDSVTSAIACSAPSAIAGVKDSIGPVKPKITPIFMSEWPPATAPLASAMDAADASNSFLM